MGRVLRTAQHAISEFFADGCPKLAAAISYYTLFSLFPIVILGVAALGFVFKDGPAREEVVQGVLDALPLTEQQGRADLEQLLREVSQGAGSAGIVALAALAVSASSVMGAVRFALNTVHGAPDERPPLTGKLLDVLAVLGIGAVLLISLGVSVIARELGVSRVVVGEVLPTLLAFGVYALVLRVVPPPKRRLADVWPGALVGALGYTVAKSAFLAYVTGVSTVYASLGAIIAFLLFTWIAANLFLLGAEVAVSWPLVRDGRLEDGPDEPLLRQVLRALRGTVVRTPARPDRPPVNSRRSAPAERG